MQDRVAVVGGGVAGLSAAIHLRERGVPVTLFERSDIVGGKVKGWDTVLPTPDGRSLVQAVEHGMHGWWGNYKNFKALLDRIGGGSRPGEGGTARLSLTEYSVIDCHRLRRTNWGFSTSPGLREYENFASNDEQIMGELWHLFTPRLLNPFCWPPMLRLLRASSFLFGISTMGKLGWLDFTLHDPPAFARQARRDPRWRLMAAALSPHPPAWLDQWTLAQTVTRLPITDAVTRYVMLLQQALTYWKPEDTSAYHVARCFDFYALRDPGSLWFEMCRHAPHYDVIGRLADHAIGLGVDLQVQTPVHSMIFEGNQVHRLLDPQDQCLGTFAETILATDVPGVQRIVANSALPSEPAWAAFREAVACMRAGHLLVIRMWMERRLRRVPNLHPVIGMIGSRETGCPFDFMILVSTYQSGVSEWPGDVLEVHVSPADRYDGCSRRQLLDAVLDWILQCFPELDAGGSQRGVAHVAMQEIRTFTENPAGTQFRYPRIQTAAANLFLCGDFVRYDASPVAYMEKAFVTGMEAANGVLARRGLAPVPILQMPPPSDPQRYAQEVTDLLEREGLGPLRPTVRR